jgi:pSer/pThr/pTyr-binding forkhead associated (FHA) protein
MQEHAGSTAEYALPGPTPTPRWHERARAAIPGEGHFLACLGDQGEVDVHRLEPGWTRIGRSVAADVRLDDPSVSRRHALVVLEGDSLRVLDDRSLNGVILNDEAVEWGRLEDGDELAIGRFRLLIVEA